MKLLGGVVALMALLLLRPMIADLFREKVIGAATANRADCLSMLGSTTNQQDGGTYIIGSIRNNCDHAVLSVTVTFKLQQGYGPNKSWHEGLAYAYARDVAAGETRK